MAKAAKNKPQDESSQPQDLMSQCVALCQEEKWREAALLYRKMLKEAGENDEAVASLKGAQLKIEYSLRRQMAAALIKAAGDLLSKEYLLDVG